MDAKKCDRCNRFYTKYDHVEEVKPSYRNNKKDDKDKPDEMFSVTVDIRWTKRYYSGASYIGEMEDNVNWDLCPWCASEVMKVLFAIHDKTE